MPATELLQRAGEVIRTMLGVPSYERYSAYMKAHHPQCALLSRDQFLQERLGERATRPGSRCC